MMTAASRKPLFSANTRSWLGRAFFESTLIVLGVVLGFWVNEWRENRQREADGRAAIERVAIELRNNREAVARVLPYHERVAEALRVLRSDPPSDASLIETFFSVADSGFGDLRLNDEVWRTALSRDSFARADFSDVQAITSVYNLADNGARNSWSLLVSFMTETSAFSSDQSGVALMRFSFAYDELVSQERYLIQEYDAVLKLLEADE